MNDSGLYPPEEGLRRVIEDEGVEVKMFLSGPRLLLVDLDDRRDVKDSPLNVLLQRGLIVDQMETTSRRGNKHFYFRTSVDLSHTQRRVLELALGSDPTRALLDLMREWDGCEEPSALYETPEEAARVEEWMKKWTLEEVPF